MHWSVTRLSKAWFEANDDDDDDDDDDDGDELFLYYGWPTKGV